jgi:hypothetical protein
VQSIWRFGYRPDISEDGVQTNKLPKPSSSSYNNSKYLWAINSWLRSKPRGTPREILLVSGHNHQALVGTRASAYSVGPRQSARRPCADGTLFLLAHHGSPRLEELQPSSSPYPHYRHFSSFIPSCLLSLYHSSSTTLSH